MDCSTVFGNDDSDNPADLGHLSQRGVCLADDEVHVWSAKLDQPPSRLRSFCGTLAPDERTRAGRYYFQRDRDRFVIARGVLRAILGSYLSMAPRELCFRYNSYGKPHIRSDQETPDLRFNLAHSHEIALLAVTRGRELGIDIENVRSELEVNQLADHFFSPPEVAKLRALPAQLRTAAFFNYWTRKEAYVKARGEGLSIPLDQFDVSRGPLEPIILLEKMNHSEETRWSLVELTPVAGYAAALVVEGRDWKLKCGHWRG
jgi:4'-phosphopantetheinyl transferase